MDKNYKERTINLELGGGGQPIRTRVPSMSDYYNLDAFDEGQTDIIHDVTKTPWPLNDNSVQNIYSCEFIEHISYREIQSVLKEAYRVLVPGGRFAFECPDFEGIVKNFSKGVNQQQAEYMRRGVIGDHSRQYDYHLNIVWFDYIKGLMEHVGFKNVQRFSAPLDRVDYQQLLRDFTPEFMQSVKLCVEGFKNEED